MKQARSFCNTHLTLSDFLDGGTSTTQRKASLRERYAIMCKYYGTFVTVCSTAGFAIRFYIGEVPEGAGVKNMNFNETYMKDLLKHGGNMLLPCFVFGLV